MEIKTRNTNTLMPHVYRLLALGDSSIITQDSRNGPVRRFQEPVSICLARPWERVNFSPTRDCNPFFHLMEALAMLGAFNNVKFMTHFAKTMGVFSDDGNTYNAFYGTRMRRWAGGPDGYVDQLRLVVDTLAADPNSRQALVNLWDVGDLTKITKDKACNLNLLFDIKGDELCMTSFNRSNDAILGSISGANTVHLSIFHEYVANALNRPMGPWWHISNNLHVYTEFPKWALLRDEAIEYGEYIDPYDGPDLEAHFKLFPPGGQGEFEHDNTVFLSQSYSLMQDFVNCPGFATSGYAFRSPFIKRVAVPMFNAWQAHKRKTTNQALQLAQNIDAHDWRLACTLWLERRTKPYLPQNSNPPIHA